MKNYIGIAAIVLGALILVISYFTHTLVDYNGVQVLALVPVSYTHLTLPTILLV